MMSRPPQKSSPQRPRHRTLPTRRVPPKPSGHGAAPRAFVWKPPPPPRVPPLPAHLPGSASPPAPPPEDPIGSYGAPATRAVRRRRRHSCLRTVPLFSGDRGGGGSGMGEGLRRALRYGRRALQQRGALATGRRRRLRRDGRQGHRG